MTVRESGADPEADRFLAAAGEGRLVYSTCSACGDKEIPARSRCGRCGGSCEEADASSLGTVVTFTRVHRSADDGFRDLAPYVVAIVSLDDNLRIIANVEPPDRVEIGVRGWLEFRPSPATGAPAPVLRLETP